MDASREELVELLKSLGIVLPPKTKLPSEALNTRLLKALDSTQRISKFLPPNSSSSDGKLNPAELSKWSRTSSEKLLKAVERHNMQEATMVANSQSGMGPSDPFPLYANPFMDVRQTMMSIGNLWDTGCSAALMQNQEGTSGIAFRVSVLSTLGGVWGAT